MTPIVDAGDMHSIFPIKKSFYKLVRQLILPFPERQTVYARVRDFCLMDCDDFFRFILGNAKSLEGHPLGYGSCDRLAGGFSGLYVSAHS